MLGQILCKLGFHKWKPLNSLGIRYRSKWDRAELFEGQCERCGVYDEIEREY